jgi:hypothetical protein
LQTILHLFDDFFPSLSFDSRILHLRLQKPDPQFPKLLKQVFDQFITLFLAIRIGYQD